jgi:hypothetical protein
MEGLQRVTEFLTENPPHSPSHPQKKKLTPTTTYYLLLYYVDPSEPVPSSVPIWMDGVTGCQAFFSLLPVLVVTILVSTVQPFSFFF